MYSGEEGNDAFVVPLHDIRGFVHRDGPHFALQKTLTRLDSEGMPRRLRRRVPHAPNPRERSSAKRTDDV